MMRRSPMKPGTKPLKRTGFVNSSSRAELAKGAIEKPRKPLKSRRPPQTKIRAAARGQECTLLFPRVCNGRTDTTVLCHSNQLQDGKGMRLKAPDTRAAFGCCACHDVLDGRAPRPYGFTYEQMISQFDQAVAATHAVLRRMGLLKDDK